MDKEEHLRRTVKGNRRAAGLKAWDTRMMNEFKSMRMLRTGPEVDADSRSVASVLYGDEETDDEKAEGSRVEL